MNQSELQQRTSACLKYISEKYPLSTLTIERAISLALEWGWEDALKNADKVLKWRQEQEEKEKAEEAARDDYTEEVDADGRTWYKSAHLSTQRKESRKLSAGDIIKFRSNDGEGIMVVGSFDYESDFAVRAYYCAEDLSYKNENGHTVQTRTFCDGVAPGVCEFSFATDEEIKQFFSDINTLGKFGASGMTELEFYFKSKFTPEKIKEKCAKYVE